MKKTFFIILLVTFFLGCTIPGPGGDGGDSAANATYLALGIVSFASDAPQIQPGGMTNVRLSVRNYGTATASNIRAKLLGYEGHDITIEDEYASEEGLAPGEGTDFFWTMEVPDLEIDADVTYTLYARLYYDYESEASREIIFMQGVSAPTVTSHSSSSRSPIGIILDSLNPIRMNSDESETEFTVSVDIQNDGQGFVGYLDSNGDEIANKDNYLDSVVITIPGDWDPLHPDDWDGSGNEMSLDYDNYQDTRMRLVRGKHTSYSIGFVRDNVQDETIEGITMKASYSYYVTTPNSVVITVLGQQHTY